MSKKHKIKLEAIEGGYGRESWWGIGPIKAKINEADESLSFKFANQDVEIVPPKEGQYGNYYTVSFLNSKAFVDLYKSKDYGTYMRVSLFNDVELPAEVVEKMKGTKSKPKSSKSKEKKVESTEGFWG